MSIAIVSSTFVGILILKAIFNPTYVKVSNSNYTYLVDAWLLGGIM